MTIFILILLGIVQGLTEFLPISSSGHLVILYNFFGIKNDTVFLSIILHLATLLSIIIYYRKDIITLIRHPFCPTIRKIVATTIATCVVVITLKPIIDNSFGGSLLPMYFVITGIILYISDWIGSKNTPNYTPNNCNILDVQISYYQAIIIGLAQGIACIPGISRSGTTIATSKFCGVKNDNAKYSFLISIPIILGSLLIEIMGGVDMSGINFVGLGISFVICFLIGLLCIKFMTKLLNANKMKYFSFYLFILSILLTIKNLFV